MLHSSRYAVEYTAEHLLAAPMAERQDMLDMVVSGLLNADLRAGNTAYCLAKDLTEVKDPFDVRNHAISFDTETSHGKLTASMSLDLVRDAKRLSGFIGAIKRWPEQEGVIDVGCGSFPILALASALYHPRTAVTAIEINPAAAEVAARMVDVFGLSDRVNVVTADIANYPIDVNTTAAVTETFNSGLQQEPGPKIVRLLHERGVPRITPSRAALQLRLASGDFTQDIDLRTETHASIDFTGWAPSPDDIYRPTLRAEYYDDLGLVLGYDKDIISKELPSRERFDLKRVMMYAPDSGSLRYELGVYPFAPVVRAHAPSLEG